MDREDRQRELAKVATIEGRVGAARLALRQAIQTAHGRPVVPELVALAKRAGAVDLELLRDLDKLSD